MPYRSILILILVVGGGCSSSGDSGSVESSTSAQASVVPDVVYGHKDGLALTLDVYRPETPNGAGVISVVSAGWKSSWNTMLQIVETADGYRPMTTAEVNAVGSFVPAHSYVGLLESGFTVFAVRHGSSPRYPMSEIVADMRRAVRFVRFHAEDYGVDRERLGVFGGSAGGQLSLLLGTTAEEGLAHPSEDFERESTRVRAVVAYYSPTDFKRWGTDGIRETFPAADLYGAEAREFSPVYFASDDDAATLILHGELDELVPITHGETMYRALYDAGVIAEFVTVEGSGHGFYGDDAVRANTAMVDWFTQHLK